MLCGILLGIDDKVEAVVAVVFVFIASAAHNERYGRLYRKARAGCHLPAVHFHAIHPIGVAHDVLRGAETEAEGAQAVFGLAARTVVGHVGQSHFTRLGGIDGKRELSSRFHLFAGTYGLLEHCAGRQTLHVARVGHLAFKPKRLQFSDSHVGTLPREVGYFHGLAVARILVEEDACADDAEQENAGQTKAVAEEHAAENLVTEGF